MPTPSHRPDADPAAIADQLRAGQIAVIDVREPLEYATGHIPGSANVPLGRITATPLPSLPLVLVCQSGKRSGQAVQRLLAQGHGHPISDLAGGLPSWELAGLPLARHRRTPLPLMRQVQVAAGSLVLLGLLLSQLIAPAWILLTWFVGVGLTAAGFTGFCGMARLLAVMPWNRLQP